MSATDSVSVAGAAGSSLAAFAASGGAGVGSVHSDAETREIMSATDSVAGAATSTVGAAAAVTEVASPVARVSLTAFTTSTLRRGQHVDVPFLCFSSFFVRPGVEQGIDGGCVQGWRCEA